ncbi:hypothetical protein T484DRAFT_1834963 [Baffinella frigidus]|nr:hypothetical protein T484DRAFT_1834963 [Cryptophyta sp. CCMP2293]
MSTPAETGLAMPEAAPAASEVVVVNNSMTAADLCPERQAVEQDPTASRVEEGREGTAEEALPKFNWDWKFRLVEKVLNKLICSAVMAGMVALYFSMQPKWFNTKDAECDYLGEMPVVQVGNSSAAEVAVARLWREQFYKCVMDIKEQGEDIHVCYAHADWIDLWFAPVFLVCFCLVYFYTAQPLAIAALGKVIGPFTAKVFEDETAKEGTIEYFLWTFKWNQTFRACCAFVFGILGLFVSVDFYVYFLLPGLCVMFLEAAVNQPLMAVSYAVQNCKFLPPTGVIDEGFNHNVMFLLASSTILWFALTFDDAYCSWVDISPQPGLDTRPNRYDNGLETCHGILARACYISPALHLPKIASAIVVSSFFDVLFLASGACWSACRAWCKDDEPEGVPSTGGVVVVRNS